MQPGPTEYSQRASSHQSPSDSPDLRQHGYYHSNEPVRGPSRLSGSEREGPTAEDEAVLSQQSTHSPLSQPSSPGDSATDDPSSNNDAAASKKRDRHRDYSSRKTIKSKKVTTTGLHVVDLPNEILTHILSYLPAETLTAAALVCHRFHQLVTTPHAWRDAFLRYFPGVLPSDPTTGDVREAQTTVHGRRAFTRLTALASWRSEYILRTRLLRSVARGKPPALPPTASQQGSKPRQALGSTLFESQQVDIVDRIHGDFGSGVDGRRPKFRYGTTYVSRLGHSDPSNNAPDTWGLRENNLFSRFDRDFFGLAQPFGLGAGEMVGTSNPMDVSQPFGAIHAEGVPGGRIYFHHAQERDGRFINSLLANTASATAGIPYVDPETESICAVWIAKNDNIPTVSNGLLGMLSGASSGILTAYSLGTDGLHGRRLHRGQTTARWALCPGVPITNIKVDDSYNVKRYGRNRVLAIVLNALGEVYYLKDMFTQSSEPLPERPDLNDINAFAWKTGRSVNWGLVESTARIPAISGGNQTPSSSWFGAGLTENQLKDETLEIERYLRKKPKYFREACFGWDMQRRLEVDFAGDDENGAGEALLIFQCGIKDGMSLPLRATRFVRRYVANAKPKGQEITATHQPYASSQDGSEDNFRGDPDPDTDRWLQSDFHFGSVDAEIVTTAIDGSSFATLTVDEDPLLNLSASTLSSPWASPAGAMPRPENVSEIPGHRARLVAAGTNQGSIILWDIRAPVAPSPDLTNTVLPVRIIRTDSPGITCLGLTALYLVHGGTDGLVQAWDPLASASGPLRTLNSRYSIRSRHRFVLAGTTPDRAGYDFFVAGGISLDPDSTTLRGMVTLGSLLRYWHFSSDAAEQYRRSKRRWRRHQRSSNQQRDAEASFVMRGASMKYYIADEVQEMQAEQRADRKEQERLADRFGVGLLGPGATEAEMLAYATLLSNEVEERRNFGRAMTPPAASTHIEGLEQDGSITLNADPDVDEAIRRSLRDSSPESYPVRYKDAKRGSPKSESLRAAVAGSSSAHVPSSSRSPDADDVEFALQLSLAEEQSREEAAANVEEWQAVEDFPEELPVKGKGKEKAR